ncbi:hypothetical protein CORT_0G03360 [Candida orthopsilosis Co 90-125]|uniref:Lipase n=1 Tax=Candida orthopsilosis (strain 90-125) TaxID=1136231 RepID=H8XA35_CANO9|nr:hypothetical protein CORT_0G03360 [Candida orthopsilosis Co 90-125]CCG25012.1 hypothetical protein CORT_0G03360 [Candida orthopsilosis Co 90-125]
MKFWFVVFLLVHGIFAAVIAPVKPSQDKFYTPPDGYEDAEVGTILKYRKTPVPLSGIINEVHAQNSWQLLVRSEDTFGNPNAFVTTVIQPFNATSNKVVSYQTWEDAANLDCSPSYGIQYGADITTLISSFEMYFMGTLLDQGYYVVTPDYEGPKSTFTVGLQSGKATLNSIRAALSSGNLTGIDSDAEVMMWGYSGGTIASGWAAAIQSEYAPELSDNLIGAALGGFVTNITATAEATDGGLFAGLIANALGGLGNEYSNLTTFMEEKVSTAEKPSFERRDDHCLVDSILGNIGSQFFSGEDRWFPDGWQIFDDEPVDSIVKNNGLVYQPEKYLPQIPMFIYQGTQDNIVPIKSAKKTFQQWCEWGLESGEFAEDEATGHITEVFVGAPAALTWIINRFNGVKPVQGCNHTSRASNFDYPGISQSYVDYFTAALNIVLGFNLGPLSKREVNSIQDLNELEYVKV